MLKVEKLKSILNCNVCNKLLTQPIALPCGETVCYKHLSNMIEQDTLFSTIKCSLCEKDHVVPEEGFQTLKSIDKLLEIEVNKIDLGPKFNECNETIDYLKISETIDYLMNDIEEMKNDPENFIYSYFSELKKEVDIQRETLKLNIDSYYEEMIINIESSECESKKLAKKMNDISDRLQKYKEELNELIEEFDTFEINDAKYDSIHSKAESYKPKYEKMVVEIKNHLLGECSHEFVPIELNIKDLFGSYTIHSFNSSNILTKVSSKNLIQLCGFSFEQKWKLVYRATVNGFGAQEFHDKCDGVKNTLTIIKSTSGYVFGGYTNAAWSSNGSYSNDPGAFLFSLTNTYGFPRKIACSQPANAIYCHPNHGPRFGSGPDLIIQNQSNANNTSSHNLVSSYPTPSYPQLFNGGVAGFQTTDIEVFFN